MIILSLLVTVALSTHNKNFFAGGYWQLEITNQSNPFVQLFVGLMNTTVGLNSEIYLSDQYKNASVHLYNSRPEFEYLISRYSNINFQDTSSIKRTQTHFYRITFQIRDIKDVDLYDKLETVYFNLQIQVKQFFLEQNSMIQNLEIFQIQKQINATTQNLALIVDKVKGSITLRSSNFILTINTFYHLNWMQNLSVVLLVFICVVLFFLNQHCQHCRWFERPKLQVINIILVLYCIELPHLDIAYQYNHLLVAIFTIVRSLLIVLPLFLTCKKQPQIVIFRILLAIIITLSDAFNVYALFFGFFCEFYHRCITQNKEESKYVILQVLYLLSVSLLLYIYPYINTGRIPFDPHIETSMVITFIIAQVCMIFIHQLDLVVQIEGNIRRALKLALLRYKCNDMTQNFCCVCQQQFKQPVIIFNPAENSAEMFEKIQKNNNNILNAKCGHNLHVDCLEQITKTTNKCPIDETAWDYQLKPSCK